MSTVATIWSTWLVTVSLAAALRNRIFAIFVGVFLGISALSWSALFVGFTGARLAVVALFALAAVIHSLALTRPGMRPVWYRALISIPGLWFVAGSWLAIPWAMIATVGLPPVGWQLPYLLALVGVVQSLRNRRETVDLTLDGRDLGPLARLPASAPHRSEGGPLTIAQITDPHLGPFMSVARLRAICERVVAQAPDLVLITGDILTMESQGSPDRVAEALAPLARLQGRVFACLGNHDHEARATVAGALDRIDARLLVDEVATVGTPAGPVEIVGADYHFRDRGQQLARLFAAIGPKRAPLRLLMLHDPGAFKYVPPGAADLTLSGHTHGGHVGLVSLGLNWTVVSAASDMPDHGVWAKGTQRLYVHRGTGHYGFPVRLGVPGEESLLRVRWAL